MGDRREILDLWEAEKSDNIRLRFLLDNMTDQVKELEGREKVAFRSGWAKALIHYKDGWNDERAWYDYVDKKKE